MSVHLSLSVLLESTVLRVKELAKRLVTAFCTIVHMCIGIHLQQLVGAGVAVEFNV